MGVVKCVILLKRRPDLTPQEFRARYEAGHVQLAHKYLGHLFSDYRRNYAIPYAEHLGDDPNPGFADSPYDCVTEIWLPDQSAWNEMQRITADPVIGRIFQEDEETFMDRDALKIFVAEEVMSPREALRN